MKIIKKVIDTIDAIIDLSNIVAIILSFFAMFATSYEVVMRYFLNRPTAWVTETTSYSLLFITFLAAPWLLKKNAHVKVDILLDRLNPRTQVVFNVISSILGAATCLTLFWYGTRVSWNVFTRGYYQYSVLNIPYVYIISVVPVGSFLLFIQFLRITYGHLGSSQGARKEG